MDSRNPKYLNTAQTTLYTKGEHLYGLVENTGTLQRGGLAVVVEGPIDAFAVDVASGGMLAASRAYERLTAHGLDPRGAALPAGQDPASTLDVYGPAMLMDRLTGAEPMGRQLVEQALDGHDMTWVHERVNAARIAAGIILKAPPTTWEREIVAVTDRGALGVFALREAVIDGIATDTDALGRLTGRDRRDDLDRGQRVQAIRAQLAAMSGGRTGTVRPAHSRRAETGQPAHALATSQARPPLADRPSN